MNILENVSFREILRNFTVQAPNKFLVIIIEKSMKNYTILENLKEFGQYSTDLCWF